MEVVNETSFYTVSMTPHAQSKKLIKLTIDRFVLKLHAVIFQYKILWRRLSASFQHKFLTLHPSRYWNGNLSASVASGRAWNENETLECGGSTAPTVETHMVPIFRCGSTSSLCRSRWRVLACVNCACVPQPEFCGVSGFFPCDNSDFSSVLHRSIPVAQTRGHRVEAPIGKLRNVAATRGVV